MLVYLLEFIPDLVWVLLFFVGVTMMIAGQFLRGLPLVMQYRLPIMFAGFFLLMLSTWSLGVASNEAKWQARLVSSTSFYASGHGAKAGHLSNQVSLHFSESGG